MSDPGDGAYCGDAERPPIAPPSIYDIERTLAELYALYQGLPGFIDVYYRPVPGVQFFPTFTGEIPEAAQGVESPVPVTLELLAGEPDAKHPGPNPSTADIRCTGRVRPGARMTNGCTLSFLFTNGTRTFAGTAGHCVAFDQSISVDGISTPIGRVVYSSGNAGVGNDFAIILVNQTLVDNGFVTAEMCDWAGPTTANINLIFTETLVHTGHGQYVGVVGGLPPRPRVYVGDSWGATSFTWYGGAIGGDSGSAIRVAGTTAADARALGTVTHSLGVVVGTPTLGFGTRIDRGISLAASNGYPGLSLLTVSYVHPI